MMERTTKAQVERITESVENAMRDLGLLPDGMHLVVGGANGQTEVTATGGEYLGTGHTEVTGYGTKREVYWQMYALRRALDLQRYGK